MNNPVHSILHKELIRPDTSNLLTLGFDGFVEDSISNTGHRIIMTNNGYLYPSAMSAKVDYVPETINMIPKDIVFDAILYNSIDHQKDRADILSKLYHVPNIFISHSVETHKRLSKIKNIIFTHELVKGDYDRGEVIHLPIEVSNSDNRDRDIDVLIFGSFIRNDYGYLKSILDSGLNVEIYGNNPGLSEGISVKNLKDKMSRSKVYLSLSNKNTNFIPTAILEAMGSGCCIVSNTNSLLSSFMTAESGRQIEAIDKLVTTLKQVVANEAEWTGCGSYNQEFIKANFGADNLNRWKDVLQDMSRKAFII